MILASRWADIRKPHAKPCRATTTDAFSVYVHSLLPAFRRWTCGYPRIGVFTGSSKCTPRACPPIEVPSSYHFPCQLTRGLRIKLGHYQEKEDSGFRRSPPLDSRWCRIWVLEPPHPSSTSTTASASK